MTTRTPSSAVPLAAQSRLEPEPYSLPARTTSGMPLLGVGLRGVVDGRLLAGQQVLGEAALDAVQQLVRSRMLANVPRIITSWLPRREP